MAFYVWLAVCIAVLRHIHPAVAHGNIPSSWCTTCSRDIRKIKIAMERLEKTVNVATNDSIALQRKADYAQRKLADIRCETGIENLKPHSYPPNLSNERIHTKHIVFFTPFHTRPQIMTGIVFFGHGLPIHFQTASSGVNGYATRFGFPLSLGEFGKASIRQAEVRWMACAV